MQFQADILDRPVMRSGTAELSALGASLLAGLALGWWNSLAEIGDIPQAGGQFAPAMTEAVRVLRYAGWKAAVARARLNPEAAE
jgi:glycerol kinase